MNQQQIYEKIKQQSKSNPISCTCSKCTNACKLTPCIGTPQDILRIMNNGHIDKLSVSIWMAGMVEWNFPPIPSVQATKKEDGSCIFLTADNLCMLHNDGMKPTEGKLVSHISPESNKRSENVNFLVATSWLKQLDSAKPVLKGFTKYIAAQQKVNKVRRLKPIELPQFAGQEV